MIIAPRWDDLSKYRYLDKCAMRYSHCSTADLPNLMCARYRLVAGSNPCPFGASWVASDVDQVPHLCPNQAGLLALDSIVKVPILKVHPCARKPPFPQKKKRNSASRRSWSKLQMQFVFAVQNVGAVSTMQKYRCDFCSAKYRRGFFSAKCRRARDSSERATSQTLHNEE